MNYFKSLTGALALTLILSQIQGCAAVVVAGATGAATAANDRRTIGTQIDDNTIEMKAGLALGKAEGISDNARIVVKSLNGNLLVVGQSPNDFLRDIAIRALGNIDGVKRVHNQIKIGSTTSMSTRTMDTWITTRVKLKLLTEKNVDSNNIGVLTENAEVYLMGLVSKVEADKAAEIARNISGVAKVVKVFEIL